MVNILALYTTVGYFCCSLAVLALGISASPSLIKHAAPVIAPHVGILDMVLQKIGSIDQAQVAQALNGHMHTASGSGGSAGGGRAGTGGTWATNGFSAFLPAMSTTQTGAAVYSSRVEELPADSAEIPVATVVEEVEVSGVVSSSGGARGRGGTASGTGDNDGLRRRRFAS